MIAVIDRWIDWMERAAFRLERRTAVAKLYSLHRIEQINQKIGGTSKDC